VAVTLAAMAVVAIMFPPVRRPILVLQLWRTPVPPSLPGPVDGVRSRQIADTWGGPRSGGRKHKGVDIFAPRERPYEVRRAA
jgi:peptidoglycan LD-endopeptidase LytH